MNSKTETLKRVNKINARSKAVARLPLSPHTQALLDAGLLKSSPLVVGPLALPTGEVVLRVTEAGNEFIAKSPEDGA